MYPEVVPIDGNIELIQNSGIQFVDLDILVDWKTKDNLSMIKAIENGYFIRLTASKDDPLVRLVPKITNEVTYVDPVHQRAVDLTSVSQQVSLKESLELYDGVWFPIPYLPNHIVPGMYGPTNWARARIVKVTDNAAIEQYLKSKGQLASHRPNAVKYTEDDDSAAPNIVAADGAQAATDKLYGGVAPKELLKESESYYRIVLAFDTQTQSQEDNLAYFAPLDRDVESGERFKLAFTADRCSDFLKSSNGSLPWVREWAEAVFKDLYKERIKPKIIDEEIQELIIQEHLHEAHYLNMLAFLGFLVEPSPVHFVSNGLSSGSSSNRAVDVSLILDIGNARSCGIMVEDHPNVTRGDDDFSDTYVLNLRDLNAPEQVYNQPFASMVEFSVPNFDYDNRSARSGRPDAFSWPSMVRVGNEAAMLAAHREGNEGTTGITSPKRYLWNTDRLTNDKWMFNNYSYQIKSKKLQIQRKEQNVRAYLNPIGYYFNTDGNAYFALNKDDNVFDNLESRYSNRSTMTFMLIELFVQAMVQMNSVSQREQCTSKQSPRRLKSVILTTPPGMPAEERELYRGCVYEALGILWKSFGYDKSSPREFKFSVSNSGRVSSSNIDPPVPDVYLDWNEAEAGQVVYVYNESQKTYKGDCQAFVKNLRRPMMGKRLGEVLKDKDGDPLYSSRIASLDIGGGTTDLVIKDYSFKSNVAAFASDIIPREIFKDGFKIAGDDIIHDIIKECIMPRLALTLAKYKIGFKPVLQRLVGDSGSGNVRTETLRSQFTQQILVKIAYKILFHLENLDPYDTSCVVKGSVQEFLLDQERNPKLPLTVKRMGAFEMPSQDVINYADGIMGEYLQGFSIMNFKFSFDIAAINRAILEGSKFNICRILSKLCEVITAFDVDLLLLTGRSSKLPAIRAFFMQRLNLPSMRIVAMHSYRCDSWYPFKRDGETIGDPKTTASVGALLSYLRLSHDKFPNFRFYSYPEEVSNNAHYVGIVDNANMISNASVLYKYESARMLAKKNESDEDDEESNFIPYNREDESFNTQLSVEIGCRLLDDENVEATPLYKIEAHNSVDDIARVKQALALTYNDINREEVTNLISKFDFEIQERYSQQAEEILKRLEDNENICAPYKGELEKELKDKVTAEIDANTQAPTGLKKFVAKFTNNEDERNAAISARYAELYSSEVTQRFEEYVDDTYYNTETELSNLLNSGIEENIALLRERFTRGFEQLKRKLNIERCGFSVTLKTVNRHSPYPMAFIKQNLPNLKQVESFELESVVADDGKDYTPYFRMYLKTISGAKVKYFMDSGSIDLNGINPRFIL